MDIIITLHTKTHINLSEKFPHRVKCHKIMLVLSITLLSVDKGFYVFDSLLFGRKCLSISR